MRLAKYTIAFSKFTEKTSVKCQKFKNEETSKKKKKTNKQKKKIEKVKKFYANWILKNKLRLFFACDGKDKFHLLLFFLF